MSCSFLFRHSNLGIPGVWAFHIGSASPLDNVKPAIAGGDLSKAHPSVPLRHSSSHAVAPEGEDTEDNLDYYDENEEEVEYPPGETEEESNGHSPDDVSFHSRADLKPSGGGISLPGSDLPSPLPRPTSRDGLETESATLDPQTKEGRPQEEIDAPDLKGRGETSEQPGAQVPAPPKTERDSPDPSWAALPPHPDGGALPAERDVPPVPSGGEVVLPNYPRRPDHAPPLGRGRQVVGVEDDIGSNTKGKWLWKMGAKNSLGKCWFCRVVNFLSRRVDEEFNQKKLGADF